MNHSAFGRDYFARLSRLLLVICCLLAVLLGGLQLQQARAESRLQPTAPAYRASATPAPTATPVATRPAQRATPLAAAQAGTYAELTVGFTEEGRPFIGDLNAPITIDEYSDYLCPFCGRHFRESYPLLLDEYVATGKVRLIFHEFPIPALHPTAPTGHQAALCVAEQGAARFWAMHDALFARQSEWNNLPDPTEFVGELAVEAGADPVLYDECMAAKRTRAEVEAGIDAGRALGFDGTPTFRLTRVQDGYSFDVIGAQPITRFREVLDAMLAGESAPAEPTPAAPALPYWASEGLAPDPDKPGFTLAGDPYKGSEDATLTIVEFSDFQCPACATHANEVQPVLDAELIESGAVRWVFKNLPLRVHPYAPAAAAAAECAGDQGQFWPMHDQLFARQADWAEEEIDAALATLAAELELDLDAFVACTASRQALERVLTDLYDAQGVAESTPTFIFLDGKSGAVYRGSRDATDFVGLVIRFIETMNSQETNP